MDFGLKIGFSLKEKLNNYTTADLEFLQKRIEEKTFDLCEAEGLTYVQSLSYDRSFLINLYPEEREVEFIVTDEQYLVCIANSSSAGPGYHAFLIRLLKHLEETCHIKWQWQSEEHGFYCDGSYHNDESFEKLQQDMSDLLAQTAQNIIANDLQDIRLSMPSDCHVIHEHFAVSPMGFWERDYFEAFAKEDLSNSDKKSYAAEFYPWWTPEVDAFFWFNLGICLMNVTVPWRPIRDPQDQGYLYCVLALRAFEAAQEQDPTLPVPIEEMNELHTLLHECAALKYDVIPHIDGLGFRRLNLRHTIEDKWQIELPGFFYNFLDTPEVIDENAVSVLSFCYNDILIECRIYQINPHANENVTDYIYHDTKAELIDEYRDDHFACFITKEEVYDKQGEEITIFNGEYGYQGQIFVITASYNTKTPDGDIAEHDWILQMLQMVDHVALDDTPKERLGQRKQN